MSMTLVIACLALIGLILHLIVYNAQIRFVETAMLHLAEAVAELGEKLLDRED